MEIIGEKVKHRSYGIGVIISVDGKYVSIRFEDEEKPRKFPYPDIFKSFACLLNEAAALEIDKIINQSEEKKQQEQKQKETIRLTVRTPDSITNSRQPNKNTTITLNTFGSVETFCNSYKSAVDREIQYLMTLGEKRQHIFDGKRIEYQNGKYIYTFESDEELNYPEGTQISIWYGQNRVAGNIIDCEEFIIIIASSENLGMDVPSVDISAEHWRLLKALNIRLDEVQLNPSNIVEALVCDGHKRINLTDSNITIGQDSAMHMAETQPITFIWGPPGTGKTQTLARIALTHIRHGNSVLMLSYSNVSVDGATMRVYNMMPKKKPGVIIRYGYPRNKELFEHEYLTANNFVIHDHPALLEERQKLQEELKKLLRTSPRYVEIKQRIIRIKDKLRNEEKESVKKAKFVATTISKAIVDTTIRDNQFDVVIFDEASMAYVPQIVYSASLARKHFVCMGDFRQLPPIVQGSKDSILNVDIFQYCGVSSAIDSGRNHKWLCMLDTQYRMHPHISDFASHTMYRDLLKSAENMEEKRRGIVEHTPSCGDAIKIADLSGMMSVCTKTGDNSRINVLSALISFSLALEAIDKYEVGVITPYNAQSRLLHAMAQDVAEKNPDLKRIYCATVHQFQGSEKDVIIYDAVDCYRMQYPGILLTSTANDYANRLFNVALTRAKGKFVAATNVNYMKNKKLSPKLMFEKMIRMERSDNTYMSSSTLLYRRNLCASNVMSFFVQEDSYHIFINDIANAQNEIRLDIPDVVVDDDLLKRLSLKLYAAKSKGKKVYVRVENKQNIPASLLPYVSENPFVVNPVTIIDKHIIWFGLPNSDAVFKSEGIDIPTLYRPIIRFEGKYTATSLYGFLDMNRTDDQSVEVSVDENGDAIIYKFSDYVLANTKCPECGKPMRMKKNAKGKFFLTCSGYPSCPVRSQIDTELVEDYLHRNGGTGQHCIRCNYSLEAKIGQYGLYVQCCGTAHHKYKLDEI